MRLIRCNRCGAEQEAFLDHSFTRGDKIDGLEGWARITVIQKASQPEVQGKRDWFDLCGDCREIFVEQFLKGAPVAPITQPLNQVVLPHQPMTDCQLVWDEVQGAFLCYHDNPQRYQKLITNVAQDVAEGVPPKRVVPLEDAVLEFEVDTSKLEDAVGQMSEDMHTAGWAHSMVQRCTPACNEGHTYRTGCLLMGQQEHIEGTVRPYAYGSDDVDLGIPPQRQHPEGGVGQ